jgi:hypothetical protein
VTCETSVESCLLVLDFLNWQSCLLNEPNLEVMLFMNDGNVRRIH